MTPHRAVKAVQRCLHPGLLKPRYRKALTRIPKERRHLYGQCYVASEAVYHLLGGKRAGWVPVNLTTKTGPHWYLRNRNTGQIVDPTAGQFACELNYARGRAIGFLTRQPSKKAKSVIACVKKG